MTAYRNEYYSTSVMLQIADALQVAARRMRAAAKALHTWLESRRRAAIAFHEFERMSDRTLRDIGLCRADVMGAAWGVERTGDRVEAIR